MKQIVNRICIIFVNLLCARILHNPTSIWPLCRVIVYNFANNSKHWWKLWCRCACIRRKTCAKYRIRNECTTMGRPYHVFHTLANELMPNLIPPTQLSEQLKVWRCVNVNNFCSLPIAISIKRIQFMKWVGRQK